MASAEAPSDAGRPSVAPDALAIDVAWSPAPRELLTASLTLPLGATLRDALAATGWEALDCARHGDEALAQAGLAAAVWGRARPLSHALRDGDRVEVLRGLAADPMDARRVRYRAAGGVRVLRDRAAKAQVEKKG